MKRLISIRVVSDVCRLNFLRKSFCSDAPAKISGANYTQTSTNNEQLPKNEIPQYDIAIVGGGMVGMALACSLASMPLTKQLKIAIIDSNPALVNGVSLKKDDPPDSRNTDMQKKIYSSRLTSMTLSPSTSVAASNDTSEVQTRRMLAKLELSDGNQLYAKLVVGADGSKSHVRKLAGIKTTGWKYSQNAIICTVEHKDENRCAWQRFLPSGPIALLPIGDNFSNIVWTMDPADSSNFTSMNDDDFVEAVNHALDHGYGPHPQSKVFGEDLFSWFRVSDGRVSSVKESFELPPKVVKVGSTRMAFPLSLMHANNYTSKRVALVGDAAHTVHPLAGQGVNMGFGDAFSLSSVIADGVAVGSDIGEVSMLKKYEGDRKAVNVTMMAILDGFQKAYSVDFGPLNVLRAAAFHGAQYIPPLKRNIISYASGENRLPFVS